MTRSEPRSDVSTNASGSSSLKQTLFFEGETEVYVLLVARALTHKELEKIVWLFSGARHVQPPLRGTYVGPRREMLSPWSTNTSDVLRNVGIEGVRRVERFRLVSGEPAFDPMLEMVFDGLDDSVLHVDGSRAPSVSVTDIGAYSAEHGLALSTDEIEFLETTAKRRGRSLTDAELFGFGQLNSEHCRHKIFNGAFVIDGKRMPSSLFSMIKETSKRSGNRIISAYKDNVAFVSGFPVQEFAPQDADAPSMYRFRAIDTAVCVKAETHNYPTTVEPFYGASTGSGGEIRDRMAGGQGSIPLAGTAVYMASYSRLDGEKSWEKFVPARPWRYQSPEQILVKASNGASDFGNKFGQPLIVGSLFTFEMLTQRGVYAFDRCIMLAGGIGYADRSSALKRSPKPGDKVILFGGDNYRIGLAGAAVSSVETGVVSKSLELSAVQRANPEMQKRVFNVVRALAESGANPIVSIHDHGAGGHMNCFAELLEETGGRIDLDALPIGDPTLSDREIISNESQERMGLIVPAEAVEYVLEVARRERAPAYVVGEVTNDQTIRFVGIDGREPVVLETNTLFGSTPRLEISGSTIEASEPPLEFRPATGDDLSRALQAVLSLEGVACKDWLTNKVDRCVSGRVAQQQTVGPLQLPLANFGAMLLDYSSSAAVCTSLGHAPGASLIDPAAASRLSIAEALTNLCSIPIDGGIQGISLSANWMWPAKQPGEDSALYRAVEACSEFAISLGIPIPTGKDSLSMTMKYGASADVRAPGTVIITAVGNAPDANKKVTPDLKPKVDSILVHLDFSGVAGFPLGGTSYAQTVGALGDRCADVSTEAMLRAFGFVQQLLNEGVLLAAHDVSSGGLLVTVAEMCFAGDLGATVSFAPWSTTNDLAVAFCEKPGMVLQVLSGFGDQLLRRAAAAGISANRLGVVGGDRLCIEGTVAFDTSVAALRDVWWRVSCAFDARQTATASAVSRRSTLSKRSMSFSFPAGFDGTLDREALRSVTGRTIRAAVIREQGTNGEREMAFALHAAGFAVRDVMMSDLVEGREDLRDISFIAFPGGFANSDVLGAGKGWAGVFRYNERALSALRAFYSRPDTLSLAVCNGCQLVTALELFYPEHERKIAMHRNASEKFESAFVSVDVEDTASILLKPLKGARLGIWVAHGEGRFELPEGEGAYDIALRYSGDEYPMNPNGSPFRTAGISSRDGRHLAMMPHLERSLLMLNWAYAPSGFAGQLSPWSLAFGAAYDWIAGQQR